MESLPFQRGANPNAYLFSNDDVTAVKVLRRSAAAISGHFARIRYNALPQIENAGDVSDLVLPTGAGLYEPSHFTLYLNHTPPILALELNQSGPKYTIMGGYMVEKLRNHPEVFLDDASPSPIMRGDVFDQVMQLGRFAEVDLVIRRDAITEIEQAEETN